jgi:hypothetical protein
VRIRFGLGLPGPFYLTSGRSRGSRSVFGAVLFLIVVCALIIAALV